MVDTYNLNHEFCLRYQRVTASGCKDIGMRKSELVAKNQYYCTFFKLKVPSLNNSEFLLVKIIASQITIRLERLRYLEFKLFFYKGKMY